MFFVHEISIEAAFIRLFVWVRGKGYSCMYMQGCSAFVSRVLFPFHLFAFVFVSRGKQCVRYRAGYIPSTTAYGLVECLVDLQETAARLLVVGGRLCFWLPDFTEAEEADEDASTQHSPAGADTQPQAREHPRASHAWLEAFSQHSIVPSRC